MKKNYIFILGILLAQNVFAQSDPMSLAPTQDTIIPTDTTVIEEPPKPSKDDLFQLFTERSLPLTLDITNGSVEDKIVKARKLAALPIDLMQQFFQIPALKGKDEALYYYPMGSVKVSDHVELFICLEQWAREDAEDLWQVRGYTFKNRETFIDEIRLGTFDKSKQHKISEKSIISPEFNIDFTRTEERTLEQNEESITFTATIQEDARLDSKGKCSGRIEKTFAGILIENYDDSNVPEEVYKEGKTLWGDIYRDAFGEHYAIITYNTLDGNTEKTSGTAMQLHFYHYIKPKGASKFEMIHQSVEQTKSCNLEVVHFINAPRPIILTDLDKNGVLEASIIYWLDCRNTTSPSMQMFLAQWSAKREHRLPASVDLKMGTQTSTFNQQWGQMPEAIRTYVGKLMTKAATKTKMK